MEKFEITIEYTENKEVKRKKFNNPLTAAMFIWNLAYEPKQCYKIT